MARRRVGGGRLRVDAARAVAKLRDFQLWDPALWALEIVRAAIALRSSRVRAHGDADDVWVSWEGEPLADTDMVTLFDELVSPVADAARRPLRLLAMGVNSGLGTGTSFVDVLAYRPDAPAHRVRYTPDVLVVDDDSPDGMAVASGLRRLRVEKIEPARGAPSKGAAIHVRRRKGLAVLGRFLSGTEPRELAALRHACEDAPVPVVVGRAAIGGGRSSFDLVRVPLGAGIDGFLALTERSPLSHDSPDALLDVGELGVHLVSYPLDLGLGAARAPIPVRAWVDAPVMPTNASRSDVRRDEPPLAQAIEAARAKVPDLLSAVVGLLATEPATQHATAHHARVRRAALRLVGSFVGGALWHAAARALADHALLPLLDAPLVRDAIGRPRSVLDLAKKSVGALGAAPVHRGDEAIDERLEDWLGDVLWIPPGDAAGYLVGASSPPDVKTHIKKARSALKARAAFRARPERPAALPVEQGQLLSVRLDRVFAPDDPWASTIAKAGELRGEVCLCLPEPGHRFGGAVELMAEGRSVVVEPLALGPRFVAIVEASATRPDLSYQGIVADEALTATLVAVRAAIVRATEGLARWLCGEEPRPFETRREELGRPPEGELRAIVAETIRHGLSDAIAFLGEVGVEQPGSTPGRAGPDEAVKVVRKAKKGAKAARSALFAWDTPLVRADAWRMADGTWRSVRALEKDARFGSLGVVAPDRPTHHLPKRPIVVADEREIVTLRRVLPRSLAFLSYAEAGDRPFDPFRVARDVLPTRGAALEVKDERRRGVIVWGVDEPRLELRHANRVLVTQPRPPVLTGCAIVVDDDDLVPAAGWQALAGGAGAREALEPVLAEWEHRMLDAVARAVLDGVP
ncbi:MAG: hypothetical protein IT379_18030, partial [Deltaproteobacteria bacterium]|nr:hypothetical protein [Deltaproteobacteria bacterium]